MSGDRELLAANLKRISDGDQRGMHVSATHYAWLGNALAWNERINADMAEALDFITSLAQEEYEYCKVGTGAEVTLRHIIRKASAAIAKAREGAGP